MSILQKIKKFLTRQGATYYHVNELHKMLVNDLKTAKLNLGQIQGMLNAARSSINSLHEVEFQVFSQWGDDGIIQYLVNKLSPLNKTCIEFGVENYRESNTRYLLINNNWSGYVIDGSDEHIRFIEQDTISWACELYTRSAFITAENINELLKYPGFEPEVGLLSIDIDGNDYWIWRSIDVISPVIVVSEYNALFGNNTCWTVPYDPAFDKYKKHSSIIYYGASLGALCQLAEEKGYVFVGCNSAGNNAYFVRKDRMVPGIPAPSLAEGFVRSRFREAMVNGRRPIGTERVKLIMGMPVWDVASNKETVINPDIISYS